MLPDYIGAIEDSIVKALREGFPNDALVVEAFPGEAIEYLSDSKRPINNNGALVRYRGGAFEDFEHSTRDSNQSHAMIFEIAVVGKQVRNHAGLYEWLSAIRGLLHGLEVLPEDNPGRFLNCQAQQYLGQLGAFYIFSITFGYEFSELKITA